MDSVFVSIGMSINVLLTSGVLWKLMDFAKNWGALEATVEAHTKHIDKHCGELDKLRDELAEVKP